MTSTSHPGELVVVLELCFLSLTRLRCSFGKWLPCCLRSASGGEAARREAGRVQGRQPQARDGRDAVRLRGALWLQTLLRDRVEPARLSRYVRGTDASGKRIRKVQTRLLSPLVSSSFEFRVAAGHRVEKGFGLRQTAVRGYTCSGAGSGDIFVQQSPSNLSPVPLVLCAMIVVLSFRIRASRYGFLRGFEGGV